MNTREQSEMRQLTAEEIDGVTGGLKIGPLNLYAGEAGLGISLDGIGSLWIGPGGVCGSIGSKGGCL
jgi:hypothetical protein